MISTADLQGMPGPEIDPDTFGADSPAVPLTDAVFDIDDDGVLDTRTFEVDDALVVATDGDGDFSAWEFHRDADGRERWERTDSGTLGGA